MAKVFEDGIDAELAGWLESQPLFFVATAPSSGGHVNVSPKGYDTIRVIGPHRVAYRDLTGSGVETVAHLGDDGRITVMWCAFDHPPRIVRVQGTGRVLRPGDDGYDGLDAVLPTRAGARAIIEVVADRISEACGFSVPLMTLEGERDTLDRWATAKNDGELETYWAKRNATSIDGLPGLEVDAEVEASA